MVCPAGASPPSSLGRCQTWPRPAGPPPPLLKEPPPLLKGLSPLPQDSAPAGPPPPPLPKEPPLTPPPPLPRGHLRVRARVALEALLEAPAADEKMRPSFPYVPCRVSVG